MLVTETTALAARDWVAAAIEALSRTSVTTSSAESDMVKSVSW